MAYILATGFENRDTTIYSFSYPSEVSFSTTDKHSGEVSLRLSVSGAYNQNSDIKMYFISSGSCGEAWLSLWGKWLTHIGIGADYTIEFLFADQSRFGIGMIYDSTDVKFYTTINTGDSRVQTSDKEFPIGRWCNLKMHITPANSGGLLEFSFDGDSYYQYYGDTLPGSNPEIIGLRIYPQSNTGEGCWLDDIVVSDSGECPDMRFIKAVPTSDNSVQFVPSSGSSCYAMIDETPPSDSDYVSSGSDGDIDYYNITDFSLDYTCLPQVVSRYTRARKEVADASQFKTRVKLDADEDVTDAIDLLTTYKTFKAIYNTAPDDSAWDKDKIDDLIIGIESVIP